MGVVMISLGSLLWHIMPQSYRVGVCFLWQGDKSNNVRGNNEAVTKLYFSLLQPLIVRETKEIQGFS